MYGGVMCHSYDLSYLEPVARFWSWYLWYLVGTFNIKIWVPVGILSFKWLFHRLGFYLMMTGTSSLNTSMSLILLQGIWGLQHLIAEPVRLMNLLKVESSLTMRNGSLWSKSCARGYLSEYEWIILKSWKSHLGSWSIAKSNPWEHLSRLRWHLYFYLKCE